MNRIIEKMYEDICNELIAVEEKLLEYPDGRISCQKNGKYTKWFLVKDNQWEYVPKTNKDLAIKLAEKEYYSSKRSDLLQEKKALDRYRNCYEGYKPKLEVFWRSQELGNILNKRNSDENENWCSDYIKCNKNPEGLRFESITGNMLRSKSEIIIEQMLFMNKIQYRYECELILGEHIVYPDFTIKHPVTGKIVYWEHFGMMDNEIYAKNAFMKLQIYNAEGIMLGDNLIATFETRDNPLNSVKVQNIIQSELAGNI